VDTHRLGAGSKLPQNIVGLIGVANGVEGDLRTGLPFQMVEIHDPLRMLTIIEQTPQVVQQTLDDNPGTKQWYSNNWMNLAVIDPHTGNFFWYDYAADQLQPLQDSLPEIKSITWQQLEPLFSQSRENLPVMYINH
jgi:hypothetical protein